MDTENIDYLGRTAMESRIGVPQGSRKAAKAPQVLMVGSQALVVVSIPEKKTFMHQFFLDYWM